MKKLLLVLIPFFVFALDDATIPNTFTAGTRALASEVNENFDSLKTAFNRTTDTLDNNFVRFTDFLDSTIDTINVSVIRGNPDVDSLKGNIVMDTASLDSVDITKADIDTLDGFKTDKITMDSVRASGAGGLWLMEDGGAGIFVKDGGNVGIGSSSPNDELEISTLTTNPRIRVSHGSNIVSGFQIGYSGNDAVVTNTENGIILFGTNNIERARITSAGNVGIDTTTPASKVHVAGSIRARDTVFADNVQTTTYSFTKLNIGSAGSNIISSNAITFNETNTQVDTEGSAALDTIATINGGSDGDIIYLHTANNARDVVLVETGNIETGAAGSRTLDNTLDVIKLIYISAQSTWCEVSYSTNGS